MAADCHRDREAVKDFVPILFSLMPSAASDPTARRLQKLEQAITIDDYSNRWLPLDGQMGAKMAGVYASTTSEWFETLSQFHRGEQVAFWQPTPANPRRIAIGEAWYFKELGRPRILGVGRFSGWESLPVQRLFQKYGTRAGYSTLPELIRAFESLTDGRMSNSDVVGNVILDNFTPFSRPILLSEIGLDDLAVRFRYLFDNDPLAEMVPHLLVDRAPGTAKGLAESEAVFQSTAAAPIPTTGPTPTDWRGEVARSSDGEAFTYAIRFGSHDIWKVGWTKNIKKRVRLINNHIPTEIIPDRWRVILRQKWDCAADAHRMEQLVLHLLEEKRTQGERVRCSENDLLTSWRVAFERLLPQQFQRRN